MATILVVEDELALLTCLEDNLKADGHSVITATDGKSGYTLALEKPVDCIVLDLMLPRMDGFEVVKALRKRDVSTPILILTVKSDEVDKVLGLELGADDYLTKPFSLHELAARIRALLRRSQRGFQKLSLPSYSFSNVQIDFKTFRLTKGTRCHKLKAKECDILRYLIERKGEVVSRQDLLRDVWNYAYMPSTRTVDNYIVKLRKMIEDNPAEPGHILSVWGAGYQFTDYSCNTPE